MTIRDFTPDDYAAVVALGNSCWPEYPGSEEELRHSDATRDPKCLQRRWLAHADGELVGKGAYQQSPYMHHPRKFEMELHVHPERRRRGIGTRLFREVLDGLAEFDPLVVRTGTRADMTDGVAFLQRHGFTEEMRSWESRLNVPAFDFSPYADADSKPLSHGIRLTTLAELADDPDRDRKLYEACLEIERDVPAPDQITEISFEHFLKSQLNSPNLLPDAYFIAVDDGQYVGVSTLWKSQGNDDLYTGLTGVRRSHRRKGIALALKLRAIRWARENERALIKTWNESNNRAMLSINEMLGFEKQPAWISYVKVLKVE